MPKVDHYIMAYIFHNSRLLYCVCSYKFGAPERKVIFKFFDSIKKSINDCRIAIVSVTTVGNGWLVYIRIYKLKPKVIVVCLIQHGRKRFKWIVNLSNFIDLFAKQF